MDALLGEFVHIGRFEDGIDEAQFVEALIIRQDEDDVLGSFLGRYFDCREGGDA
jgi:hypothetical protein